jgi:hypothetical protein
MSAAAATAANRTVRGGLTAPLISELLKPTGDAGHYVRVIRPDK